MITPDILDSMLSVMRKHNVMSANIESNGEKIAVTLGPEMPASAPSAAPVPGGWKTEPSDPHDPDPLGLGALDAPMQFDVEDGVEL